MWRRYVGAFAAPGAHHDRPLLWLARNACRFIPARAGRDAAGYVLAVHRLLHEAVLAGDPRVVGVVGSHRPHRGVAVRLSRQHGRLAVACRPRHVLGDARPLPRRHGGRRAADPAGAEVLLRIRRAPGCARRLRHAHPLAGAPLRAAPVDGLLQRRFRRPRRHQGDADRHGGARSRHEGRRGAALRLHLLHRRGVPVRGDRSQAVGAAAAVARRLPRHHALLHPAPRPHLACAVGRALHHDRPHRRHLYQHLDGEDVRPCRPRGRLRPREHEPLPRYGAPAVAAW